MKRQKYLTYFKLHCIHPMAYRPWRFSKKSELFWRMKWGKGPNTALWTISDCSRLHLLGFEYLQLPRTSRETEKAAAILVSVGGIEIKNISILGWGICWILWIPIHLSLLCVEISIQVVRGQDKMLHTWASSWYRVRMWLEWTTSRRRFFC